MNRPVSGDLDVAVDAELDPILERLGLPARRHERFGTAAVHLSGWDIDLARTRTERYPEPGALPEVEPAGIEADLSRRDFTVNAMALELAAPGALSIRSAGPKTCAAARSGCSTTARSPTTRPGRSARPVTPHGSTSSPIPRTLALLRSTDLGAVSADRRDAELARLAAEPTAARGFELLGEWQLLALPDGAIETISVVERLAADWGADDATRTRAIGLAATGGDRVDAASRLAAAVPERPSRRRPTRPRPPACGALARRRARRRLDRALRDRVEPGPTRDRRWRRDGCRNPGRARSRARVESSTRSQARRKAGGRT